MLKHIATFWRARNPRTGVTQRATGKSLCGVAAQDMLPAWAVRNWPLADRLSGKLCCRDCGARVT